MSTGDSDGLWVWIGRMHEEMAQPVGTEHEARLVSQLWRAVSVLEMIAKLHSEEASGERRYAQAVDIASLKATVLWHLNGKQQETEE